MPGSESRSDKIETPKKLLDRAVKLEPRPFLTALAKLTLHASLLKWDELGSDVIDASSALGLDESYPEVAGKLVIRSATSAAITLLRAHITDIARLQSNIDDLTTALSDQLLPETFDLTEDLFSSPATQPVVNFYQHLLRSWLEAQGIGELHPETVASRFPSYFVSAMQRELHSNSTHYRPLLDFLSTPVVEAWQRERSWEVHQRFFNQTLDESVFGQAFSLRQIFIWPRAYPDSNPSESQLADTHAAVDSPTTSLRSTHRIVVQLRETLDDWLSASQKDSAVRVLSGDPGAGKSAFVRMYAQHRMSLGDYVLVVSLHMLNVQDDLIDSIENYCQLREGCPTGVLAASTGPQRLLLVLDGLDELSKQGAVGATVASQFVEEVLRTVSNRNAIALRLNVLISGRPIAVQNVQDKFRKSGQVLHLLPYALTELHEFSGKPALIRRDDRDAWWIRYGELTGHDYRKGMPTLLKQRSLDEITAQPLLNHLVALVYESGKVDFASEVSRNEIYSALVERVYERDWDPTRRYGPLESISRDEFRSLLEEMALTAWHDRERITTVSALKDRCAGTYLADVLDRYEKRCGEGVGQLFAAFYFKKGSAVRGLEPSYEFTHKSFAEYLTSRRIVDAFREIHEDAKEAKHQLRRTSGVWSERVALLQWLRICGPGEISDDLLEYLRNELHLVDRSDPALVVEWQQTAAILIRAVAGGEMPIDLVGGGAFEAALQATRNAVESLFVIHSCCADVTRKVSPIGWPSLTAAGRLIRFICLSVCLSHRGVLA